MSIFKRPHKDHPWYSVIVILDNAMIAIVVLLVLFLMIGCTTTKIVCPQLAPPPASVVDALETASKDANAASWVIGLDRHYQKQETCR